jgi:Zn-dependent alcohol dehydrogenase
MAMPQARAVRFDRYGGREVLYVADIDMPTPAEGEVLVETRAAGVNPGGRDPQRRHARDVPGDIPIRGRQ